MTDARDAILQRIRTALGRTGPVDPDAARRTALGDGPGPRPVWEESTVDRFTRCFEAAAGTWTGIRDLTGLGTAVADYLGEHGLIDQPLRLPEHPLLRDAAWPELVTITRATPVRDARAALSVAFAGVAETGSLILPSGPESPTTLDFLPDHHLVVLHGSDVVPWFEDVWARLRQEPTFPPRSLNFITGPSRTADVEQTLQLGAHGPRSLHLFLIGAH